MSVKIGRLSRRQPRYARLQGEVFSFHEAEHLLADEEFDMVGALVEYSDAPSKKSFRLSSGRRVYTCYCNSYEEMLSWAQALSFATAHCFEQYYTLGSLLAEGTYSRVYYAYALEDPSKVYAVKVIKKRAHDVQALEWLHRERHVNSVLNHPSIVQVIDMFSSVERDHLVFELMRGGTLADLLKRKKRLPESYARVVMKDLFTALHHIHSKNIVHRDVRPENIFCSATKFPMSLALGDFGYANFVSEKRVNLDVLTTMIGTPPYIAVDIVRRVKYGPLVDLWSSGVVLYEMLSGETPFRGHHDRDVIDKIRAGDVTFDNPVWKAISPDAIGLIRQLLQPDQHKRVSALASLQHQWLHQTNMSRPMSMNTSCPTSPSTALGLKLGDRDSPGNTSTDSRRHTQAPSTISNLSRIPSSSSSQSPLEQSTAERSESSERQTSFLGHQASLHLQASLGLQSSMRSMHHVSSVSSLSGGLPHLPVTPSVRAITEKGLQRVASDNPARMKRLMSSSLVQKQLSVALPYRRKLIVTARAFVAVFRLRALTKGHSATRQLSVMGKSDVDDVNALIDRRKAALETSREESKKRLDDRSAGQGLPAAPKRGHVRQRSRDVAQHIMGRLSMDRKPQDLLPEM